ncbi:Activator of Hsp90 ATPase N-terminal [Babesia microti strain RI]|uniref:Activator of Hsp90 ATPase N-terminal n=1 Tax=Babesia microti (strain RI) TaxID=1133968 RepID=I7J5Z7_BABMR|nr:Activator of Hsp90 ATPase N-terminal [Babesia microti strain RI]CCF73352.1 Activator of Hsp90 ATPase N-terminal [Babesia microti strain RI]|eukprot:XP_012647961.1 Activator of Hsp90 ATPase N-terminal [Babesia microti strain RI]
MSSKKSNNWHWDEKNYGKWSQEYLSNALKGINFQVYCSPLTIDAIDFNGHTTVSMRKGAQIVTYEYEIKVNWSVKLTKPVESNCENINGLFEIKEFDTENLEDESYVLSAKINCHDTHTSVLNELKNNYFKLVKKALSNFTKDLKAHDASKISIEEDIKGKITEREKPAILSPSPPPGNTVSAWNHNGYHWEEKPMTKWSQNEIKRLLESKPITICSTTITLKDVSATGESSVTIRRGNKVIYYDFVIKAKWEGSDGCEGSLETNNFNSAENADKEIDVSGEFEITYEVEKGSVDTQKITVEVIKRLNEYINLLKLK